MKSILIVIDSLEYGGAEKVLYTYLQHWNLKKYNITIVPINPKTWDIKYDLSITVFILSAIGFVIVLFMGNKEPDIIEKNEKGKR